MDRRGAFQVPRSAQTLRKGVAKGAVTRGFEDVHSGEESCLEVLRQAREEEPIS